MSTKYSVIVESYAERHYIKNFKKKYRSAWNATWRAVVEGLKRMESLLDTSVAEIIINNEDIRIIKTEFRVAGTNESRKSSGNRCIIAVHDDIGVISVLLVYHKNDLRCKNETAQWKKIIKENYIQYRDLF